MMFWRLMLLVGAAGLVTSTGYLLLVVIASARFRRNQRRETSDGCAFPPVTLLKPVCGMEPDLESRLDELLPAAVSKFRDHLRRTPRR